jgi:hypothetical protein
MTNMSSSLSLYESLLRKIDQMTIQRRTLVQQSEMLTNCCECTSPLDPEYENIVMSLSSTELELENLDVELIKQNLLLSECVPDPEPEHHPITCSCEPCSMERLETKLDTINNKLNKRIRSDNLIILREQVQLLIEFHLKTFTSQDSAELLRKKIRCYERVQDLLDVTE